MPTIFELGSPSPRFAKVRFGSSAREVLATFRGGRPLPRKDHLLSARVYVKDGTSPPLGDCPRSLEGIVLSVRACEALGKFLTEFELVRVGFHGLGSEKRSGIWYKDALHSYERKDELEQPFFYLHPITTRLPGHAGPTVSPDRPGDGSEEIDLRELSKWMASVVHFQQNMQVYFEEYFLGTAPPPVFAFGNSANVFFTEEFRAAAKRARLNGFTFSEVARV